MGHQPIVNREMNGGTQEIFRFENGFGASVIRGGILAYGGLELAVLEFTGAGDFDSKLTYETPITDDVVGYLDEESLSKLLDEIKALPAKAA